MTSSAEILARLEALRSERNIAGMVRYGICPARPLGISMAVLRSLAREIGRSHALSAELWTSGWHEARVLAALIEEPGSLTRREMNARAAAFDSWDICDQWCLNAFWRTPHAWAKAQQWSRRRAEFVKRAGFSLVAVLAVHDRDAGDAVFRQALTWIEREACDERRYVSKAVCWALRQIGKRNERLQKSAVVAAKRVAAMDSRAARRVAADALREFRRRTC